MKIAFIGGGNMAAALIGGLVGRGIPCADMFAIDPSELARTRIEQQFGVATGTRPDASLEAFDVIVLAVKPQVLKDAAKAFAPYLRPAQLVISVVAGIRSADLVRWLDGHTRIVRTMPNTPALIGMGLTALVSRGDGDVDDRVLATQVLGAVGRTVWFDDESKLDAVTAISGSGPAYVFYFMEAVQEAACQLGMTGDQAREFAVATFVGAATLAAQSPEPPGVLRERVTSPGGTTAAALALFDARGIKDAIVSGARAADARATEMGEEFGRQ
ncbi:MULTISPECIES: pyrroline-5-carboxylate reductase [Burkholderia]|uniref:pyrroline-5-carboxylate reductase n=1 Tax=Burkholderia TaxID=32008 RepID=UPI001589434C|nr:MULTISPECIES: pyrroline-5-carboxylate reductase [Burkholderia]MDN7683098.1 pyrroline-5-carboxylate reductase [Burkholderia cenocepacia]